MKNRNLLFLFLVAFFILSCTKTPKISLNHNNLYQKNQKNRSFTILNSGNGTLIIEGFTSSCECTSISLTKGQTIKANDSLVVLVKINQIQNSDNAVFITIKTNAIPRLTSFHFTP